MSLEINDVKEEISLFSAMISTALRAPFLYFVKTLFVVCKLFQFGTVQNLLFSKGVYNKRLISNC